VSATQEDAVTERPTGRPWSKAQEKKGASAQVGELKDLVVGYAKQETVDPLRTLGRYLGFGIAGSVILGTGLLLVLLALLRGLQQIGIFNEEAAFEGGRFSWAPYAITALAGTFIAVGFLWRLMSMSSKRGTR
jgi:hypothetical protein